MTPIYGRPICHDPCNDPVTPRYIFAAFKPSSVTTPYLRRYTLWKAERDIYSVNRRTAAGV